MPNPTAAMLVIGDEILSGRTKDVNVGFLAERLTEAGIDLREVRIVADVEADIVDAARALSARWDHVFTSGGIGPTHDDITADAIAKAFEVPIDVRADARALLEAHYQKTGIELNDARLRMARIPDGATLIDNPVSTAPGFTLENVNVMAGVPAIFQAMVISVLPTIKGGDPVMSRTVRMERAEGEVAAHLGVVAKTFPDVSVGSYPYQIKGRFGTNLVFRSSDPRRLDEAVQAFLAAYPEGMVQ